MARPSALAAALLASVLVSAPAAAGTPDTPAPADARCDPAVREALAESARAGVERDVAILRHPGQGVRNPDSIFDLSCLEDLFDYRTFDVFFDPGRRMENLLGLLRRRACAIAREAWRGYLGRPLDAAVYTARVPRLPGLGAAPTRGPLHRDGGDAERFRGIVGGRP